MASDLDGNNRVDLRDFAILANHWFLTGDPVDMNQELCADSRFSFEDLADLADLWLSTSTATTD